MIVYRVHHKKGEDIGPYNSSSWPLKYGTQVRTDLYEMGSVHGNDIWDHPTPQNDDGIDQCPETDEYCGFHSLSQLANWFDGWFRVLYRAGYVLSVYRVQSEHVIMGDKQIIFNLGQAEKVETKPLTGLRKYATL